MDIFNIKTRWRGDSLSRKTPENRTCAGGPREVGPELGRGRQPKEKLSKAPSGEGRPLQKGARAGVGWGGGTPNPERGGGCGGRSSSPTLSTSAPFSRRCPYSRGAPHPGVEAAWENEKPGPRSSSAKNLSSPVPSFCVGEERALLPAFLENRFDVAKPPANGATDTREGLFSVGSWT